MRGIKKIPTWQFLEVKKWVGTWGKRKVGGPGTPGMEAIQGCVDGRNRPGTSELTSGTPLGNDHIFPSRKGTFESMIFWLSLLVGICDRSQGRVPGILTNCKGGENSPPKPWKLEISIWEKESSSNPPFFGSSHWLVFRG